MSRRGPFFHTYAANMWQRRQICHTYAPAPSCGHNYQDFSSVWPDCSFNHYIVTRAQAQIRLVLALGLRNLIRVALISTYRVKR